MFLAAGQWNDAFLSLKTIFMQGMSGKQVQKSNASHAEEACRLRAGRRAVLRAGSAPFSAPGARRSARRERAVQRAGSAPFSAP